MLPLTTAAHVQPIGPFTVLEFPDAADPGRPVRRGRCRAVPAQLQHGQSARRAPPGLPAIVAVRDAKDPESRLILPPAAWAAFVDRVKRQG